MTPQPAAVLTDGILSMLLTHMRPLSMVEDGQGHEIHKEDRGTVTHGLKQKNLLTEMFFRAVAKSYSQFVICETCYRVRYLTHA